MPGMKASRIALVMALLGCVACGDSPTSVDRTSDISGNWEGSWTSTAPGLGGTAALMAQIRQIDGSLDGEILVIEHLCVSGFSFDGSVDGDEVQMTVLGSAGDRTEFTGTLSADRRRMSGSYTITGGLCAGSPAGHDEGTWTLAR